MSGDVVVASAEILQRLTADGADFAMEQADIRGRALRVYTGADVNIVDILKRAESEYGDRALAIEDDLRITYADVFSASRRLAATLIDKHGIEQGDFVGICMRNRPEWFIAFAAITRAGGVAVLFNSRGAVSELAAAATDVACKLILADDERGERMREAGVSPPILTLAEIEAAMAPGLREAADVYVDRDAPAVILFTSGTTGRPKGAVLTQRNLTNMVHNLAFVTALNIEYVASAYGMEPSAIRQMMPLISSLLVFPLFHISGVTTFFMTMQSGGQLITLRRWNPEAALDLIQKHQITVMSGPPLVLGDLLDQPGADEKLKTINSISVGGQATPPSLIERLKIVLPMAAQGGGWGMTEVSGSVTSAAGALYLAKAGSSGILSPLSDLRVLDDEGQELAHGEAGELWVSGALVMQGYWNQPEANAGAFRDGWLRTGDIGYRDADGFVFLVDRKKDMVISAGENIYCAEVERVLNTDPDFVETALFGVPDARYGERAIAAITLRQGANKTEEEVKALVRGQLADYKVPAAVSFAMGPFPRNVTGKVDKAKLRARYQEMIGEQA